MIQTKIKKHCKVYFRKSIKSILDIQLSNAQTRKMWLQPIQLQCNQQKLHTKGILWSVQNLGWAQGQTKPMKLEKRNRNKVWITFSSKLTFKSNKVIIQSLPHNQTPNSTKNAGSSRANCDLVSKMRKLL